MRVHERAVARVRRWRHLGRTVQIDPMKPVLKAPGSMLLKLGNDAPLSNFAFKLNLRRYTSLLAEHRQHKGAVVAVAFTPDGGRMLTAGAEGNLCVYDALQGYLPIKYLATALPTHRVALAVSPAGAYTRPQFSSFEPFMSLTDWRHPAYPTKSAYVELKSGRM